MEFNIAQGPMMGLEQTICDFKQMNRKGTVILRPIREDKYKERNVTFRCFKNPKTNTYYGIPIGKNQDGTYKFQRITIKGARMFQLENQQDAMEWHVVKHHWKVKGSPLEDGMPWWFVHDEEKEAEKSVSTVLKSISAIQYVKELTGNKLRAFGRLFGMDPNSNSDIVIMKVLLETAQKKPEAIMAKIEDRETTQIHVILKRAIATGIITNTIDKGFLFKNGIPLGVTESGAIEFLRKDRQMLAAMDMESKQLDSKYVKKEDSADPANDNK